MKIEITKPVTRVLHIASGIPGPRGIQGKSAYEVAVENGFVGTEADWLATLPSTVPGPANTLDIGTVVEGPVADAAISGTAPNQTLNLTLPAADPGPPNTLAIGTVAEGPTAGASITGTSPNQTLNLVLPEADPGPPNTLAIGTVGSGATPAASITGTSPNQTLNLTLVPGIGVPTTGNNPGDLLRWNGTVWIQTATKFHEGTGNPNGVVTAPVGSTFVNTETGGYNGARRWTKATGTGNTGWVVVDGDTGWADIQAYLTADWMKQAAAGARCEVRRVNGDVNYRFHLQSTRSSGSVGSNANVFNALPVGWRTSAIHIFPSGHFDAPNGPTVSVASGGTLNARMIAGGGTYTTSTVLNGSFTIPTTDAWPSTLP